MGWDGERRRTMMTEQRHQADKRTVRRHQRRRCWLAGCVAGMAAGPHGSVRACILHCCMRDSRWYEMSARGGCICMKKTWSWPLSTPGHRNNATTPPLPRRKLWSSVVLARHVGGTHDPLVLLAHPRYPPRRLFRKMTVRRGSGGSSLYTKKTPLTTLSPRNDRR